MTTKARHEQYHDRGIFADDQGFPVPFPAVLPQSAKQLSLYVLNKQRMDSTEEIIRQTRKWVNDVVAGCNFCPFVAREIRQNSIHYQVEEAVDLPNSLQSLLNECKRMDTTGIETVLLIFSKGFKKFDDYLELLALAEKLLKKEKYEGVYQLASFHPNYVFAGAPPDDPANYTNRSVYPMLHLLREDTIEQALKHYPHPEKIPDRNIAFARNKGIDYMKSLLENCAR